MSQVVRPTVRTSPSERAAVDRVIERLATQFPEVPAEDLVATVNGEYDDFGASRVRDFVPILVERAARMTLAGTARARA